MKFHITIKDNEENEILVDQDTDVIMGVIDAGDTSKAIGYTQATGKTLLCNFHTMMWCAKRCLTNAEGDETLWRMALMTFLQQEKEELN